PVENRVAELVVPDRRERKRMPQGFAFLVLDERSRDRRAGPVGDDLGQSRIVRDRRALILTSDTVKPGRVSASPEVILILDRILEQVLLGWADRRRQGGEHGRAALERVGAGRPGDHSVSVRVVGNVCGLIYVAFEEVSGGQIERLRRR